MKVLVPLHVEVDLAVVASVGLELVESLDYGAHQAHAHLPQLFRNGFHRHVALEDITAFSFARVVSLVQ